MIKSRDYEEYLIESLKDPEEAVGYLNAAIEGGDPKVFLLALKHVQQAYGGMAKLAAKTNKSRASLYKTLSAKGNPYFKTIQHILSTINLDLIVVHRKLNSRTDEVTGKPLVIGDKCLHKIIVATKDVDPSLDINPSFYLAKFADNRGQYGSA